MWLLSKSRLLLAIVCISSVSQLGFAGASVQAKADGVTVTDKPAAQGAVLATMKKGDTLPATERKGMFWEVKLAGGKVGYVSFMKVQRIEADESGLSAAIRDAAQKSRSSDSGEQGRARSSVMGVRGLSDGEELQAAGTIRPNMRLVYHMEDRQIDQKQLNEIADSVQKEVETRLRQRGME